MDTLHLRSKLVGNWLQLVSATQERGLFLEKLEIWIVKTTMRSHVTPVRMGKINKAGNNKTTNAGEDVEKGEPSYTVGGNVKWCSHSGKLCGGSSKSYK